VVNWLVCDSLTEGCTGSSVIRQCRECGVQLWVSLVMLPTVESGDLVPRCWPCQWATGKPTTLHEDTIQALTTAGRLDEGWQIVAARNAGPQEQAELQAAHRLSEIAGWPPVERAAPDARLPATSRSH
jgi:hypothetical protein